MQDIHEIEENLRVIRRLMERGTRYEAVTGRGALIAGFAALAVAALVSWIWRADPFGWGSARDYAFVIAWPLLAVASAAWLGRAALRIPAGPDDDATRRVSAAARSVGRAVLPAYVLSAALTLGSLQWIDVGLLAYSWIALHGVAILATSYHAPRRIVVLGWLFLAFGSLLLALHGVANRSLEVNVALALAFGGLHLGYGFYSILRPLSSED